jgi:hypothetical protein
MERAYAPHCDQTVLHAPGECEHCDEYPDWQELRELWRMNFTGQDDYEKAPDPAIWFRDPEIIEKWFGNRAKK